MYKAGDSGSLGAWGVLGDSGWLRGSLGIWGRTWGGGGVVPCDSASRLGTRGSVGTRVFRGCSVVPLDSPGGVGGCGNFQLPMINLQQSVFDILINADN